MDYGGKINMTDVLSDFMWINYTRPALNISPEHMEDSCNDIIQH